MVRIHRQSRPQLPEITHGHLEVGGGGVGIIGVDLIGGANAA
jgi:hypothetical protein